MSLLVDDIVVSPKEAVPGGVEQSLSKAGLSIVGASFGEVVKKGTEVKTSAGSTVMVNREPQTRTVVLKLKVRDDAEATLPEAAQRLEQIVGELQAAEGWFRRDFHVGGDFEAQLYRVCGEVTFGDFAGWQAGDCPDVTLSMVCDYASYSTKEVESAVVTESVNRELIFEIPEIGGSVDGLIRLLITNNGTQDWRACTVAMESRDHPQDGTANTTAKLAYAAAALTPKGGAEVTGGIAPEVRAVGTVASGTGTIAPALPAGTQAGDLLIMVAESGGATTGAEANTALTAAGWSSPPAPYADQKKGNTRLTLLYKIAKGDDATTTNDTGDHQAARIIGIKAGTFDSEAPFNTAGVGTQALTKAVSIPGATTTRDRCRIIACASGNLPDAATTSEFGAVANASLTGITELIDNTVTAGDGGAIYAVTGVKEAKGAYNATTCTAVTEAERGAASIAISPVPVVRQKNLGTGWITILSDEIVGVGHMTHRGVRRPAVRAYDPGEEPGNVQLRLRWRNLGTLQWSENSIVPTPIVDGWQELDLGEARLDPAALGAQRWQWELQARAVNGTGSIDLHRVRIYPTEHFVRAVAPYVPPGADLLMQKAPGLTEDNVSLGNVAWVNPTNAQTANGVYATATLKFGKTTQMSHCLAFRKLGFLIPEDATLLGIVASLKRKASIESAIKDSVVQLLVGGVVSGSNHKNASIFHWPIAPETAFYGSADDLWGVPTITPADINGENFGFVIVAQLDGITEAIAEVDYGDLTVYYTEAVDENRICFATRSIEFSSDGARRQHSKDDVWGAVVPEGFNLTASPSGVEERAARGIVVPSQGDLGEQADVGFNPQAAQAFVRAGSLFAKEGS